MLFLICCWAVSWFGALSLIVKEPIDRPDAILVLSGSSTFVERTQHAAELYSQHVADKILLTNDNRQGGWLSSEQRNPYFYERARWELIRLGVPAEKIEVLTPAVYSTWDEANVARDYCATRGIRSLQLVTSAYHSRRALWTFRKQLQPAGVEVGIDPAQTGIQTPSPVAWFLHLRGWQMVFVEYLKLMYYRLRA